MSALGDRRLHSKAGLSPGSVGERMKRKWWWEEVTSFHAKAVTLNPV